MATMLILGMPLPDEMLRALGLITQLTGQIEYELALVIKRTTPGMKIREAHKLAETRFSRHAIQNEARQRYEQWAMDQGKESEFHDILRPSTSQIGLKKPRVSAGLRGSKIGPR